MTFESNGTLLYNKTITKNLRKSILFRSSFKQNKVSRLRKACYLFGTLYRLGRISAVLEWRIRGFALSRFGFWWWYHRWETQSISIHVCYELLLCSDWKIARFLDWTITHNLILCLTFGFGREYERSTDREGQTFLSWFTSFFFGIMFF